MNHSPTACKIVDLLCVYESLQILADVIISIQYLFLLLIFCSASGEGKVTLSALSSITCLKKLCNHPDLVMDKILAGSDGFENTRLLLPEGYEQAYKK